MADAEAMPAHVGTFESLQTQSQPRRARPPDLVMAAIDENRVPLRADAEKLGRRESRLGLRSIFGRARNANEIEHLAHRNRELSPWPGGIRASLAEISSWPHTLHAQRSEGILSTLSVSPKPLSTALKSQPATSGARHVKSVGGNKTPATTPRTTWDPPPLFQAYPQAIKHATLPACTLSVEAILRLHGGKENTTLREGINQSTLDPALGEELNGDKGGEKAKKKHRRNTSASSIKLEWTTKIYVLVTSGYLLQYAGEGSFDRLPEKMLHLGKDSAAFASDLIPGRHWVLQVSAAMDGNGSAPADSRSLFSRLPFRGAERRNATNFLMVFEGAGDMDNWIATLRREIEALGGKKNLSETGKPKADDHILQLRAQPSQRTLVVRDPDRFSRIISQDAPWDRARLSDSLDTSPDNAESGTPEPSFDDMSTASGISHDGRQLENLRDSAHRLSFISSGQRTIITSEGSSPACSPTRDSFASQLDELPVRDVAAEVRPRPNAAAILDRRQSMQNANPLMDFRTLAGTTPRPHSIYTTTFHQEQGQSSVSTPQTTLNFSVPQSVSKRYSLVKSPTLESAPISPALVPMATRTAPAARTPRRAPPTALQMSRPLSIVADQPSPPAPDSRQNVVDVPAAAPDTPSIFSTWSQKSTEQPSEREYSLPRRHSSLLHAQERGIDLPQTSLRRGSSLKPPGPSVVATGSRGEIPPFIFPRSTVTLPIPAEPWGDIPRSKSALDSRPRAPSRSPPRTQKNLRRQRASVYSQSIERVPRFSVTSPDLVSSTPLGFREQPPRSAPDLSKTLPAIPRQSTSSQHLQVSSNTKNLGNRRSMPHLVEGPPPAPPPTCSLPPIPQRLNGNGSALSKGIRT